MPIQNGFCGCECGQETLIATRNSKRDGTIKGQPLRFIRGHHRRKSFIEYRVEDRGYATPCWIWQKAVGTSRKGNAGYGTLYDGTKMRPAHIVYYERRFGKVPAGRELDHLCRVRCCVNPEHLEAVSDAVNTQRGNNAILTPSEVLSIRSMAQGGIPKGRLARAFGVSESNIKMIVAGKTWKNVVQ